MSRHRAACHLLVLIALATLCAMPPSAVAGTQDGAVVALHAATHATKGHPCDSPYQPVNAGVACKDFNTAWPVEMACDVYLVAIRSDPETGIGGISFGIRYNNGQTGGETRSDLNGVDLYAWTQCLFCCEQPEYPDPGDPDGFPASGAGIQLNWRTPTDCQGGVIGSDGVLAVAGVFYLYAYGADVFEIIPNRTDNPGVDEFQMADCSGQVTDLPYPEAAGAVAFGTGEGRNPCQPSPVEASTWSRLKIRYGTSSRGMR